MIRKALLFGLGSVGSRHARNLAALRPDAVVIYADPRMNEIDGLPEYNSRFEDWRSALADHADADCAIIASPTKAHLEQMIKLGEANIPFYVEKPTVDISDWHWLDAMVDSWEAGQCAVGHQYRFHSVYADAADIIRRRGHARFHARDDLLDHYGPRCLEMIACHPIDTVLWLFGPAVEVDMETDGLFVRGTIRHECGVSGHDYRIDEGPRMSSVAIRGSVTDFGDTRLRWRLDANNEMYLNALRAWLEWIEGGERDPRTATLAEGLAVVNVMKEVKHVGG